ncbi:MAG: ABC transporter permease [Chloroflexi bacterium]|nr:ABC transporter permease [Chloroflexota bacterium]MBU1661330.1 ABC transporter permease [Chloroflexota bacterium]
MFNTRLIALIRKEFIQIWRDPRTLVIALLIPVMQLFLLGYAATNDVRNLSLVVFDQDRSTAARGFLDAFRASDYFLIEYEVDSEAAIRQLIDDGDARVGLIIPPDYGTKLRGEEQAAVMFVFDGTEATAASTALSAAQQIGSQYATDLQMQRLEREGMADAIELPLEIRTQVWYNPDLDDAYFMIPGLIGNILYMVTAVLTATAVVRERERGTMEQLIVTPIRPWELIIGKILPYTAIALFNTLESLLIGSWWFGVPMHSSMGLLLVLSGLFLLTSLGIGLLASTMAKTQQEAMITVFATMLPAIFLSGYIFPIEAMPEWLQWVSTLIPLRYYLVIIRSLMLKGVGVESLQTEIIALVVFGTVLMTAAALRFHKHLD